MKPTVGRIVHFHPVATVTHAALIAYVHSDTMVNLAAFDGHGRTYARTSVQLVAPGTPTPEFGIFAVWPPQVPQVLSQAEQITITLSKPLGDALERVLLRAEQEMQEQG